MHESSYDDCGCCADVHFGALLNQTSRLIRRALDARINAEVSSELSGVRGMVLGDIVRAERQGRDVYQRDIEQWFNIRRSSVTAMLQGMEQDGFITRSAVAKDARLKRLIATEKGRACHKQIEASIARFEDDLQSGIDPQQAAAARAVLEQTLRNAQHFLQEENTKQERGSVKHRKFVMLYLMFRVHPDIDAGPVKVPHFRTSAGRLQTIGQDPHFHSAAVGLFQGFHNIRIVQRIDRNINFLPAAVDHLNNVFLTGGRRRKIHLNALVRLPACRQRRPAKKNTNKN